MINRKFLVSCLNTPTTNTQNTKIELELPKVTPKTTTKRKGKTNIPLAKRMKIANQINDTKPVKIEEESNQYKIIYLVNMI